MAQKMLSCCNFLGLVVKRVERTDDNENVGGGIVFKKKKKTYIDREF